MLLIDKPLDWTSFDVVNKIKILLKKHLGKGIKVGHAGTLDPKATGLLIICTGNKTKELASYQGNDKVYSGTMVLGATTPTFDTESAVDAQYPLDHITKQIIVQQMKAFVGRIQQVPPVHSAVWINGKRAYEMARKGEEVEVPAREVQIHKFDLCAYQKPNILFEVACSKGTYVRSLANDLGKALQSGAYLSGLRRTHVGEFSVDDALTPEQFEFMLTNMK
ncbi:MAG: tRNA pseudouridine(55) synthase TruB [Bacteroidetes bacterium]|jgi:tRNA pseudouridine55 synthase|nr:tRNA pseudouridine(55) synthase TruB [Bacteroidota bacterium]